MGKFKKKIVHICMTQYSDGWTYQENSLSKYHKIMGLDVTIITSMYCYRQGKLVKDDKKEFYDVNGNRVIRLEIKKTGIMKKTPIYLDFYETLEEINPDIIFSHGCQYIDIKYVAKYMKMHPDTQLFVDNHADFSNSATNWISRYILHQCIWRYCAKKIEKYTTKFWGVLPARVEFLTDVYNIPKEKCDLLVMGADDELIDKMGTVEKRNSIRKKYNITEDDFLIVTGGKMDKAKAQVLLLMEAVCNLEKNVKLLIFGSIDCEIEKRMEKWLKDGKIYVAGWISPEESYSFFSAADLVCFPGRHSVFWEQVAGQGIPMIVKYWDGVTDIDCQGNVKFLYEDSAEEIEKTIMEIRQDENYYMMKRKAEEVQMQFRYSFIAQKSIQK